MKKFLDENMTYINAFVRHATGMYGLYLVNQGTMNNAEATQLGVHTEGLIGAGLMLVSIVASFWNKKKQKKEVQKAFKTPVDEV